MPLTLLAKTETCDIYIHGYGQVPNSFKEMPLNVQWDSQLELEDAAPSLGSAILERIGECEKIPVVLKAHGYAAAVVHYILGLGRRFANTFPEHDYVKVFQQVTSVNSYGGAFHGTPLMDYICAKGDNLVIREVMGENCLLSMTTSLLHHSSATVTSPGVPIFLIYSTDQSDYEGITGEVIARHGLSWEDYQLSGRRNQNDSIIPQFSSLGCAEIGVMERPTSNCRKIHPTYFIDLLHVDNYSHFEMVESFEILSREENED